MEKIAKTPLFNSCERFLLGTLISGQLHWNKIYPIPNNTNEIKPSVFLMQFYSGKDKLSPL